MAQVKVICCIIHSRKLIQVGSKEIKEATRKCKSILTQTVSTCQCHWQLKHTTVKPSYNDICLCDTPSTASGTLVYQLIPHC